MAVTIHPLVKLFKNPGGLADWRVGKAITQCLRPGTLLLGITGIMILVKLHGFQGVSFLISEIVHIVRVGRSDWHIHVNAYAMTQVLNANLCSDNRTPVTALGDVAVVSQSDH